MRFSYLCSHTQRWVTWLNFTISCPSLCVKQAVCEGSDEAIIASGRKNEDCWLSLVDLKAVMENLAHRSWVMTLFNADGKTLQCTFFNCNCNCWKLLHFAIEITPFLDLLSLHSFGLLTTWSIKTTVFACWGLCHI